LTETMHY